jgi:type II secretory pathway pseudopilin PulG
VRRQRGHIYMDIYILVAVLAVAAAIIIPNVRRAVHKARLRRAEIAVIERVASLELAEHARTHAYLDSLPVVLPPGMRLLSLRGDSAGWSVAVAADSADRWPVTCGLFMGPARLAPDTTVTSPGTIHCW